MSRQQQFISVPEAGRRLGRSAQSIKRLVARGKLSAITIPGTHVRIPADEVAAWVPARLRSGPTADATPVRLVEPVPA